MMNVWQVATGKPGRDYRELFSDHDVMILGPSTFGDARQHSYADGVANSPGCQVQNFAFGPVPGDRVLMRFAHEVTGVGQIPSDDAAQYSFNETFGCVYGWDLAHCRRVIWALEYELGELAKVFQRAKQKPSFTEVHQPHILGKVGEIEARWFDRPLKGMPTIDASVYHEAELGVELFRAGISNRNIEDITRALEQAGRLSTWYHSEHCGRAPTESEVISHMILPLFLGLGWSHQQIAVEWNKVDMAFFKTTPTTPENCVMVLEAKGLGSALSDVLIQPVKYVTELGLRKVQYILTTDGANLFVYEKSNDTWGPNPVAYLSVWSPQKEYILPKGTNSVRTLVRLQPSAV